MKQSFHENGVGMLWQPDDKRILGTTMKRFMLHVSDKYAQCVNNYEDLFAFSIERSDVFWQEIVTFFGVNYEGDISPVNLDKGFESYGWFPNLRLNFAENMLGSGLPEDVAVVSLLESGKRSAYTYGQLRAQVAQLQAYLRHYIDEGDVLACYMPNTPETLMAMLATTALGGVFTSTSCDFGVNGVVDRFGQSKPRVLVCCREYQYNGKTFDCLPKIREVVDQVSSIERVILVDFLGHSQDISGLGDHEVITWDAIVDLDKELSDVPPIEYVKRKFEDPLYIMYSSGTTGKPKCIVHCIGGVLLQHIKELGLHTDVQRTKNIMFFTTCGWMMWNWLVSALYFGGTISLYEGAPSYPSLREFFGLIERERIHIFGTSPKFLKALQDSQADVSTMDLSSLETILSTGSPLLPEQYDYVYSSIKEDVLLASISGGTDIVGCFFLGNPVAPVYRGELQCRGLGMDVICSDENGQPLIDQEGELVCRQSFPSRPIYFLGDDDGGRIRDAYFNHFPGVWYHGDFIKITATGGAQFFGRSDATLNPGGVRIGTSEIYRQTETLGYIEDSVCVGKHNDGDVDVVLFVKLCAGETLDNDRMQDIKARIKANTTPRHVPKYIIAVHDIPYTRSGKKIELAVARVINGKDITNKEAIANPDALLEYRDIV